MKKYQAIIIYIKVIYTVLLVLFFFNCEAKGIESYGYYVNQGVILFDKGKYNDSILPYRKAISIKPSRPEAYNNIGNSLFKLNRFEDAEKELRKAIKLNPNFAKAWHNLGNVFVRKEEYDKAIDCFNKSFEIESSAAAYSGLGDSYAGKGLNMDAIREYKNAISLDNKYWRAHLALGNILVELKKYDNAIKSYRTADTLNPNDLGVCIGIGVAYDRKGNHNEAKKHYEKAISLKPNSYTARYNMANLLWRFGELEQAEKQFKYAIKLKQTESETYIGLSKLLSEKGQYERAVEILEDALGKGVNDSGIYNTLGNAYFKLKYCKKAQASYEKAIKLNSNEYRAHYNLGNFKTGYAFLQFEKAIEHFEEALRGREFTPAIHNNIGFAYAKMEDFVSARKHFKKALEIDKNYKKAKENLNALKTIKNAISPVIQIILVVFLFCAWIYIHILLKNGKLTSKDFVKVFMGILALIIIVILFNHLKSIKTIGLKLERESMMPTIGRVQYDFFASEIKTIRLKQSPIK